jgi:protein TonB
MENKNYANATLDDIVFEHRNREYGAYVIRKVYTKHVVRGLIIAIAAFIFFLSLPVISKYLFPEEEIVKDEQIVDVNTLAEPPPIDKTTPPPPPPPPAEPPPPPVQKTIKFTPPVIKRDEEVKKDEMPPVEELKEAQVSTKTVEGNTTAPDLSGLEGKGNAAVDEVVEDKVFTFVEQQPVFPGGELEMQKFLANNIRYPSVAQRNGLEGLVVLSFVVDQTGGISEIQVLKKLGGGTDEEAQRVVKMMPKWTPGKQNGRAVKVRYTLPVRFTIK